MPSALACLSALLLSGGVHAARKHMNRGNLKVQSGWMQNKQRWCMAWDAEPQCEGETVMDIYSAFYSSAKVEGCDAWCKDCDLGQDCDVNVTDDVREICQSERACTVPPTFHDASCGDQRLLRVVWDCVPGSPKTPTAPEPAPTEPAPAVEEPAPAQPAEPKKAAAKPKPKPVTKATARKPAAKKVKKASTKPGGKEKKERQVELGQLYDPCYSFQRRTTEGYNGWLQCDKGLGCLRVKFAGASQFTGLWKEPNRRDVEKATVREKQAPFMGWGVCLPEDVKEAAASLEKLRQGAAL